MERIILSNDMVSSNIWSSLTKPWPSSTVNALGRVSPPISPEQVDGMKEFIEDPFEMNLSDYEILYGINLSNYGEVMTPSPVYIPFPCGINFLERF